MVKLKLLFSGGSEALFHNKKEHDVSVEVADLAVGALIDWIVRNLLADPSRAALFSDGDGVRPGILVLVNDVDWEITGGVSASPLGGDRCLQLDTRLKDGDEVAFISTLHGG